MINKKIKIIIGIIAIAILATAGYLAYKKYFNKPKLSAGNNATSTIPGTTTPTSTPVLVPPLMPTNTIIAGFKLYKNDDFGFEIQYPSAWMISEEDIVNVRGENTKGFFFKKPNSDLRFAILPRDGLSYGLPSNGTSSQVFIGGFVGGQQKWTLTDGRRLWLIHPQCGLFNWLQDIGRIDILSSAIDPAGDTVVFEKMLSTFKLIK